MKSVLLWVLSVFLMLIAIIYQRSTGPTYPVKGKFENQGETYKYKLLRSHETTKGAPIALPNIQDADFQADLHYKRYQTNDSIHHLPFVLEGGEFIAALPVQPAAGKMEYYITGKLEGKAFRIPESSHDSIILRYKDPVPNGALIPHVFFMFFAVLFGIRAGLSALFQPENMRKWVIVSLIGMSIGGMVLGPIVQKHAFGEYWTGFPYGGDFTDNKTLILWLTWVIALILIGVKQKKKETKSRIIVLVASIVMTIVYLIPHSMGGSTLDYEKVDQGIDPTEAIKTGAN